MIRRAFTALLLVVAPAAGWAGEPAARLAYERSADGTYTLPPEWALCDEQPAGVAAVEKGGRRFRDLGTARGARDWWLLELAARRTSGLCALVRVRIVPPLTRPFPAEIVDAGTAIEVVLDPASSAAARREGAWYEVTSASPPTTEAQGSWQACVASRCVYRIVPTPAQIASMKGSLALQVRSPLQDRVLAGWDLCTSDRQKDFQRSQPILETLKPPRSQVYQLRTEADAEARRSTRTLDIPGLVRIPLDRCRTGCDVSAPRLGSVHLALREPDKGPDGAGLFTFDGSQGDAHLDIEALVTDGTTPVYEFVLDDEDKVTLPGELEPCQLLGSGGAIVGKRIVLKPDPLRLDETALDRFPRQLRVKAGKGGCKEPADVLVVLRGRVLRPRADAVSLSVDEADPGALRVNVVSPALARSISLRRTTAVRLDGVESSGGAWTGCTGSRCEWTVKANGWEDAEDVAVTLSPTFLLPEELGAIWRASDGKALEPADLTVENVRRWFFRDFTGIVEEQLALNDVRRAGGPTSVQTLLVPLRHPATAFVDRDALACNVSPEESKCARWVPPDAAHRYGQLVIDLSKGVMERLQRGQLEIALTVAGVQLATARRPKVELITVKLKLAPCTYVVRQLTGAHGGMQDGAVLFSYELEQESGCPVPEWQLAAADKDAPALRALTVLRPRDAKRGVMQIDFASLPSAGVRKPYDLAPRYASGVPVDLRGSMLLTVEPTPAFASAKLRVGVAPPLDCERVAPDWIDAGSFRGIAVGRENLLRFGVARPEDWRLVIEAPLHYSACPDQAGPDADPDAPITVTARNGEFCFAASENAPVPLRFRAERRGTRAELLLAGAGLPAGIDASSSLSAGYLPVDTGLTASPYRLAVNLRNQGVLECNDVASKVGSRSDPEKTPPAWVSVVAGGATRAVKWDGLRECRVRVDLWGPDVHREGTAAAVFRDRFGVQDLRISVEYQGPEGKTLSDDKFLPARVIADHLDRAGAAGDVQIDGRSLLVPLDLTQGGRLSVSDFATVTVRVTHGDPTQYATAPDDSFPDRLLVASVRRIPEFGAYRNRNWSPKAPGVRAYLTATFPAALTRYPASGASATTSSAYAKGTEQVSVKPGVLAVVEPWNFDENRDWLPFANVQWHPLGVLLFNIPGTSEQDVLAPSLVTGFGLRLLRSANIGLLFWGELAHRRTSTGFEWQPGVLIGLNVNVGAFGG